MRGPKALAAILAFSSLAVVPTAAGAADVWLAELAVTLTATKNVAAKQLRYVIGVKNNQDDTGRDIVVAFTPGMAMPPQSLSVVSVSVESGSAQCKTLTVGPVKMLVVKCSIALLQPVGTDPMGVRIVVVVSNPTNGPRSASVQAMGIVPDVNMANNFASAQTP